MPTRLLIADDNPVVRAALHRLLESAGDWEIVDAENGRQAIAKAQELSPNLIILDLVMPVMDGLVAARELSKLMPQTPLLMHTLHWSAQVEIEAQKVGVRKVVPKADSRGLVAAIRQCLSAEPTSLEPQSVVAAPSDGSPSVALPNTAMPDLAALPPLLDAKELDAKEPDAKEVANAVEFDAAKVSDIGAASTSEKPDAPVELGDLATRRPAS